mgnify:CR=1 FL=1
MEAKKKLNKENIRNSKIFNIITKEQKKKRNSVKMRYIRERIKRRREKTTEMKKREKSVKNIFIVPSCS